jgi:starch-binding outer membrane protein, SusD/RagB family
MKKTVNKLAVCLLIGMIASSCSDFFNKLPLNEIVLENFYKDENDINSILVGCYAALETSDVITRMASWGEVRSENIVVGSSADNDETQILKENLLPTSKFTKWASLYTVINQCNTAIHYAPIVKDRDPNYTETEMNVTIAEATAIRALCYFYLLRTFKDVPYVTYPSIDDTQVFQVAATSGDSIVDYLIKDLEAVKEYAIVKFPQTINNTTKFSRYAIYALLADLYLWKQDYQNCIDYCDRIINYKKLIYSNEYESLGANSPVSLYKTIPLYPEKSYSSSSYSGNAYTSIFGSVGSFESLFELNFVRNQSVTNSFISTFYGSTASNVGHYSAAPLLYENIPTNLNVVFKNTDCRYLENMTSTSNSVYPIRKYVLSSVTFLTPVSTTTTAVSVSSSYRSSDYSHWIVYRLTDIVLMKAEALVQQSKTETNNLQTLQEAFKLVSATYNRSNNFTSLSTDTLKFSSYNSSLAMEDLVLLERQRELMFEGKRWFDLVRIARRNQNTQKLSYYAMQKQRVNQSVISVKLKSMDYIYFPYNESELLANPKLTQNPAYITDKSNTLSE